MNKLATNLSLARSGDATFRGPRTAGLAVSSSVRPVVLFALFEEARPSASFLRALALSRVIDAELHVVRVLPKLPRTQRLFPRNDVVGVFRTVQRTLQVTRSTRQWLGSCLRGDEAAVERFTLAHGDFVDQVARLAADLNAVLIVLPPREGRMGSTVTSLACTCGVPVLVARGATKDEAIIAATDLSSAEYPVLRRAAELGQQLGAPVIALHNINPVPIVVDCHMTWPVTLLPGDPIAEERTERLSQSSRELSVVARAVVRHEVSPVAAILGEAREHDADIIVVGTRGNACLDRILGGDVAAQVVDRAKRSVLVTPLEDAAPLSKARSGAQEVDTCVS